MTNVQAYVGFRMTEYTTPAERLRDWIESESNVAEAARGLGVSRQTVYNWTDGSKVPSIENTLAIERLTGIPSALWVAEAIIRASEASP